MNYRSETDTAPRARTTAGVAPLRLGLPKGRMQAGVLRLLADAGIAVSNGERDYRAQVSLPACDVKLLKPQNIVEMLDAGTRDAGFAGADWVEELQADLVEVLDTGLDPVQVVAAAPATLLENGFLPDRELVVASEYVGLAGRFLSRLSRPARLVRSYGATEVFPPEDADCIVDNTATGATLRANGLVILEELLTSSTRLYANPQAWADPGRRSRIQEMALLVNSVLEARRRVVLDVNVASADLARLLAVLPAMREPTVNGLNGGQGFAVKVAVPRQGLAELIPLIRQEGGADIVVTEPSQIVP